MSETPDHNTLPTVDDTTPHTPGSGPSLIGSTVGHYQVVGPLGEGGFGTVYLAEQLHPVRRRVALKVIKPGMDSKQVASRFEAERQALALMDHPGVARVYDAGLTGDNRPYFVMELVSGDPITWACARHGVGLEGRLRLMIEVCRAVQHAHMKGVIHRDLTPRNILVQIVDGKPAAKVIDFGVAKALDQPLSFRQLETEQGQMIGTPAYMPPEQARGGRDIDTRADVYALGSVLYELLTGLTPLVEALRRTSDRAAMVEAIERADPLRPSQRVLLDPPFELPPGALAGHGHELSSRLRGDLDWIVMRCLEKDRAARYDSAGALADDLERHLSHQPVEAGPPSAAYRVQKFVRRHRALVAGIAAVTLTLTLGILGTTLAAAWALREASRSVEAERVEAQRAVEAERARDEAEAALQFLTTMLESSSPEVSGREVTMREVLERASAQLDAAPGDSPIVESRLRQAIGNTFWALGSLDEAERHHQRAYQICRERLGPSHPMTLRAEGNLGGIRISQGRSAEAIEIFEVAYARATAALGEDHAITLGMLNNLAQALTNVGRRAEAVEMQARAVEGMTRVLGEGHPNLMGARVNLASMRQESGDIEGALAELEGLVVEWTERLGKDHPGTFIARQQLALARRSAGDLEGAETDLALLLDDRRRVLGDEHHDTLGTSVNLAIVRRSLGRPAESLELALSAMRWAMGSLGAEHYITLASAIEASSSLEALGWNGESAAAEVTGVLLEAAARPQLSAQDLNAIAWHLVTVQPPGLRDVRVALSAAQRACEAERAIGGPNLWMYLDTLALAQESAGDPLAAAATQQEALDRVPPHSEHFRAEMLERYQRYHESALRQQSPQDRP